MSIGHAYAQTSELFVPLPESELESLDAFEGYNFESKMVTIDTQIFSSERISITIFDQSTTFTKDSVEHYDDGNYLWIGSNDDQETAMFEISGTKAVGIIDTLNKTFQVFPVEDTTHEVYLIDHSQFPPDTVVPPGASGEQSFDRDEIDHLVESYIGGFKYDRFTEELVIDVFIAITTDALTEYGDFERFISNLVIRNTDSTYGYNDIPVELNLVDRDIVEGYTETNKLSKDLRKFQTSDEGNLERIRVLIEEEQADIAIMFVAGDGDKRKEGDLDNKCSLTAQQLVRSPSTAFAVVDIKCLAAHSATNAIGRMHGAGYDIDMERNPIFSHGHGYYDAGIASRTMMASSGGNCNNPITQAEETCRRDRAWSDPFRNFFGTTNRAGDDVSWNARVIFATAPHIASLRGPAQAYEDTRPTGFVTLPQNIPRSGSLDISATFNEIISPNFPLDVTITNGYTSTTGTMTRTSDTTFEYSHLLDGEDGTFSILFSNARDIFGNPVVRTPTSGGTVTLDANNIPQSPISGPFTTNFKDNFQGGLSQWKLTGYGRPTTATPDEVIFPATDTNTANKVMTSNQCSRICMSTIPTLLDTRQPLTISFDRFVDKSIRQDDGLYLEYSVDDGATWTTLAEYTSNNDEDTDEWEREYLSLAIPQSSAKLRLLMDVSERRGFVEVDNFKVYKPTPAEPDIILKPHLGAERTSISFSLMERIPFRLDASDFEISHGTIISLSHRANSAAVTMRVADIPYDTQITVTYTGPSILINRAYLNSGTSGVTNIISTPATMPEITAPSDRTIEATGILTRLTAEQLGTPAVTGNRLLPVTNNAPRDFPLGDTTVRWTVTDASRNSATDTQVITIRDTTPPVIQGATDMAFETTTGSIPTNYVVPVATDTVDARVDVSCNVATGSSIPVGEHVITCTATDDSKNTSQAVFRITVIAIIPAEPARDDDSTWHTESYDLSSEYLIDGLQVRITVRSSTSDEVTMIDNMSIQNMPARPPPPPVMPSAYSIYVADTDDREVLAYSEDGTYLGNLVTSRSGGLGKVWSVAFGPDGHIYASDNTYSKIRKYDGATGSPLSSSSGWASTIGKPYGITWNGNTLYVATSTGVERFSASGTSLGYFGDAFRTLSSEILTPYDVAFCSDGRMYAADRSAGKIFYYRATDGTYLGEISNTGPLNTYRAAGITCGPAIYGSGESLYQSGDDGGRINEISLSTRTLVREITTLVDEPYGMGMDNAGNLYISNKDDDNILKISSNRAFSVFASGLDDPRDVTVGPEYSASAGGSASGLAEGDGDTQQQQQQESNDAPEIQLIYNGTTVYEPVSIPSQVTFEVQATDPDGDAITIGIIPDGIPEDAISITDNGDGTAAISISPENIPVAGTHVFWVTASDVDNYDREPYAVITP